MTSPDLRRFYELHFEQGYQVEEISLSFSQDKGFETKVVLVKGAIKETLLSSEADFAFVLARFQKTIDEEGVEKLSSVRDGSKYFDTIQKLIDKDGVKIKHALEASTPRLTPFESGFWHRFDNALVKLLFERTGHDEPDLLWLIENHFKILAFYLAQGKGITGPVREVLFEKHKEIQNLSSLAEKILKKVFLAESYSTNPIKIYKRYRHHLPDSLEDHTERVATQLGYLGNLQSMLKQVGSNEYRIRILYILDVYRRVYELARPILDLLRVALDLANGVENPERNVSDEKIITTLKSHGYEELVEAFNPQIRHCESHLATRVREGRRSILLTKRKGLQRIPIQEFRYEDIVKQMKHLYEVLFPALYYAFAIFDGLLKIVLLHSRQYKLLLVSKTVR